VIYVAEESFLRDLALKLGQALEYLHDTGIIIRNLDFNGILMTETTIEAEVEGAVPRITRLDNARVMGLNEYQVEMVGDIRF